LDIYYMQTFKSIKFFSTSKLPNNYTWAQINGPNLPLQKVCQPLSHSPNYMQTLSFSKSAATYRWWTTPVTTTKLHLPYIDKSSCSYQVISIAGQGIKYHQISRSNRPALHW